MVEDMPGRSLGPALIWAERAAVSALHLLVDSSGPELARRAGAFVRAPRVWTIEGRSLAPARPATAPSEDPCPAGLDDMAALIRSAGATAVVEEGVLRAHVLGLEVARVSMAEGAPRLEVGVGRHDRAAHQMAHRDDDPAAVLTRAASEVARHRAASRPVHPANQLAPEAWLRAVLVGRPQAAGCASLAPFGPAAVLGSRSPSAAFGLDGDGRPVVVVCSTGVDPDLVPWAADVRFLVPPSGSGPAGSGETARLVLALPEGDAHPAALALAGALRRPAEVRVVAPEWRSLVPAGPSLLP